MKVLVACEFSQVVTKAFRYRGHDAYSCDIIPTEGNPDWHIRDDVLNHLDEGWDMMIAHPPCTYLAVCANRWMIYPDRQILRKKAIDFFMKLVYADIKKIVIENPISVMSSVYRKPDQYIQPYEFGHPETKKTSLWLKNLPELKPTNIVPPEFIIGKDGKKYSRIHYLTKFSSQKIYGSDRQTVRSRTYPGIAEAMAEQWSDV